MKPIRILHIVGAMNRGGTETLLMELYRHIDRTKVQFDFLLYNYSNKPGAYDDEIRELGGKIYNAKRRFYKGPISYCNELKHFFRLHPEYKIVHAHLYAMSGYMLWNAKKTNNPITIAHSHIAFPISDFLRKCTNCIGKKLLHKYADFYLGCSEDAVVELSGKYADNKTRFVMSNAINVAKFAFSADLRADWRKTLGADKNTLVLGNVARFEHQKNHEYLIRLFDDVVKKNDNSILVLVGDGSLRSQTEELAKELGVYEKVRFLGVRPDVQDIVNAFDVFVMPSRYEGLGIVLIEAQANGLPCVMSADVIPAEADTGAGLVTRVSLEKSPAVWADACLNAGKRKTSDEVGPAIVDAGFDINMVSAWLQDFYLKQWK